MIVSGAISSELALPLILFENIKFSTVCLLTSLDMAISLVLRHIIGHIAIMVRLAASDIAINVNNCHLDCHSIQIDHTPDRLWCSSCCYTLINVIYEVVKSSR